MFCPACGVENNQKEVRFCRSCGTELGAVSRAMNRSLPMRIATSLDTYLENRFQRNLSNGVVNLIAFLALLIVGTIYLASGWSGWATFMLILSFLSLLFGVWDIWIYRRNLPPTAKKQILSSQPNTTELDSSHKDLPQPLSVAEPTTKKLDLA